MKSVLIVICAFVSFCACMASETGSTATTYVEASASYRASVPTGNYYAGSDFIMIRDTWVRIVISGSSCEYDIVQCERDNNDNYAITIKDKNGNRESITVYPNKSALYYDGSKFVKK